MKIGGGGSNAYINLKSVAVNVFSYNLIAILNTYVTIKQIKHFNFLYWYQNDVV